MMWKERAINCIWVLLIVILGLLSRKIAGIPLFIGDMLYAMMIFFIFRTWLIRKASLRIAAFSLLFCYGVEISQLCQAHWLNAVRATTLGRLVLGQGFIWSDMAAYTAGIVIAAGLEMIGRVREQSR